MAEYYYPKTDIKVGNLYFVIKIYKNADIKQALIEYEKTISINCNIEYHRKLILVSEYLIKDSNLAFDNSLCEVIDYYEPFLIIDETKNKVFYFIKYYNVLIKNVIWVIYIFPIVHMEIVNFIFIR